MVKAMTPAQTTEVIQKMQLELTGPSTRDSIADPGVPKGETIEIQVDSKIFPGCEHPVKIYIPAQYTPENPACLMVKLDPFGSTDMIVFDNLIARKEIPVMIVVALTPGVIWKDPPGTAQRAAHRFNRTYEFDSMNDHLSDYVIHEVLPAIEKLTTKDRRHVLISRNGADHGTYGASTGGIGAFTLAWQRPDFFTRVYSLIGTFVSMRGGHEYPALVRKTEPRPLRIFLEDGSQDTWNPLFGSWYTANINMESALTFAGYDVQHVWGEHGHDSKPGYVIFPDVLRWLWRDWPKPVQAGISSNDMLASILVPDEAWKLAGEGYNSAAGLCSNAKGEVFFHDASSVFKIEASGKIRPFAKNTPPLAGMAFGPDGTLYGAAASDKKIIAINPQGVIRTVTAGIRGSGILANSDGVLYVTEPGEHPDQPGKIWHISPAGEKKVIDTGLSSVSGLAFSVDNCLLFAAEKNTKWVYSFLRLPDGSLTYKQPYYWLHMSDTPNESGTEDLAMDTQNNLYAATRLGIQVADPNGRVRAILPLPTPCGPVRSFTFGGNQFNTLFATDGSKIFVRKIKAAGYPQWSGPIAKPPGHGG